MNVSTGPLRLALITLAVLFEYFYGGVVPCVQAAYHVFRFAVVRYGDSEIQVSGEPGNCAGGDGQAADERPQRFHRVQVGNCLAEC